MRPLPFGAKGKQKAAATMGWRGSSQRKVKTRTLKTQGCGTRLATAEHLAGRSARLSDAASECRAWLTSVFLRCGGGRRIRGGG
jgi:hypothetical protein